MKVNFENQFGSLLSLIKKGGALFGAGQDRFDSKEAMLSWFSEYSFQHGVEKSMLLLTILL